jgi:hypothetical protein
MILLKFLPSQRVEVSPSARCVTVANVVCGYTDIFTRDHFFN